MNNQESFIKLQNRGISAVEGFRASGIACGIKKNGKDLAMLYTEYDAVAAGVFTMNLVQAAPVHLCRSHLENPIRAIVVNSGNANACTGEQGRQDALEMAEAVAANLGITAGQVLVCSTGVIGVPMPMERIRDGIGTAVSALATGPQADTSAAEAILTTDTGIKQVAYRCSSPDGDFHLAGIAKGSGMICPNMATMLAFLATDAKIERSLLQSLLQEAVDNSFNLITIDGDTSTNDTALVLANGAAKGVEIVAGTPAFEQFKTLLQRVCQELACRIVGDGEGVTKVITLTINGAPDRPSARILARSVLNSLLVKTAFYGEDANWGRIIAALGYANVDFEPNLVDIYIGSHQVASGGGAVPFSEAGVKEVLQNRDVPVLVDLNYGTTSITAWGTDLSHAYISINSNYRS
ncbi:MAG TPA: bifunctional glutamate N-acetyltransferase/amino-acid acetyltransferase ArgJ [Candidatus Limnocylindrales bacterium]|nr:bifunctional glutamate N-acetyltransferase/amino-acid acetyltransferase ArgJ [Candidatus Limnocylindrales bacterium]